MGISSTLNNMWSLIDQFNVSAQHVSIRTDRVAEIARSIPRGKLGGAWPVPKSWGLPMSPRQVVLYELMAGAVNYAYWYGAHDVRPAGANSVGMYALLDEAHDLAAKQDLSNYQNNLVRTFISRLAENQYPWVEKRAQHLRELLDPCTESLDSFLDVMREPMPLEEALRRLIANFPGYAADPFIKRACLFFIQLHRRLGWWEDEIGMLPVPADYQVPKMLRHLGLLEYSPELRSKISSGTLIPEGSREECEIRAGCIRAAQLLAEASGVRMCDVDEFLWLRRRESSDPFHLTTTTNY